MPVVYHTVHYRRFKTDGVVKKSSTFESLCRVALDERDRANISLWQRAQDRLYVVPDADDQQIILNKVADLKSAVFGEICLVQSRGLQALLDLHTSRVQLSDITLAEIFRLDERSAPRGSQFVRGLLYWMGIGDHIFLVKTQSMTAPMFQNYFDWLLRIRTSVLKPAATFTMQAEFDKAQVDSDIGEIRSLRVSGRAEIPIVVVAGKKVRTVETARTVADHSYIFEKARAIAETLFGKAKTDSLVKSLGPDEYLAVDASVKVRGKRTEESREQMREIANELADLTDGKVQVEGKDGRLTGDDAILRTRMPFNLAHEGSNLLEFDNVADQFQEVYSRFVRDGKIKA